MGVDGEQSIDGGLALLRDLTTSADAWLDPAEIRRKGRNRRRRQRGTIVGSTLAVVVVAATLISVSFVGQSVPNARTHVAAKFGPAIHVVSDTVGGGPSPSGPLSAAVAQSEQQFSISLLQRVSSAVPSSSNIVLSPVSLATALSMLELGANGATQTQMAQALGTSTLTPEQEAAGWSALSAELAAAGQAGGGQLQSANSLWLQKGLAMNPTFMTDLSRYFSSGVWQVNFAADPTAAVAALNAWVTQQTYGHITSLFAPGSITKQTALILANAVYFKAAWAEPFAATTSAGVFHLTGGTTVSVPFMHSTVNDPLDASVSTGAGVDAVQLPYKGGQMAALVIMPTKGTLSDLTASMTSTTLGHLVSSLKPTSLNLTMPKLSLSDSHELIPTLESLGMRDAFDGSADLSGMSPSPLVVSDVVQKATLDVTPWGTVASAATGISAIDSARLGALSLTIDHPFLFLIRDTQTGTILFEAQVVNPATA